MGKFDELSDLDFEELVADLFSAVFDLPFRAGTRGRDAGIDVLAVVDENRHVAQCKHYKDSTFPTLLRKLRNEAEGLAERGDEFASYRVVTSRRLNHRQRDEITEVFDGWVRDSNDVFGERELIQLLREHPEVERRHVKLWLASAAPLQQLMNGAAYERSRALLEAARDAAPRYLQTEAYSEAREILHTESVCVVAGPPGVGKTTLARLLMLNFLEDGFQPYEIGPGNLDDAWRLMDAENEKQLFYFDDFLGRTSLFENRENDTNLLSFMARVASKSGRLAVLTTREYILRQAQQLSEALDRDSNEAHRFLLTLESYSRQEKARIFYNHIYFSDEIDAVARGSLLRDRGYLRVIDHRNYNPRLVEWITGWSGYDLTEDDKESYAAFCLRVLSNPLHLWTHPFERGLDEPAQALLISMLGLPRDVRMDDLESAFAYSCEAREIQPTNRQFLRSLEVLDDSFVRTDRFASFEGVSFINPSVIDFLRAYLVDSPADARAAIASTHFFGQLWWLWNALSADNECPPEAFVDDFGRAIARTINNPEAQDLDFRSRFQAWTVSGPQERWEKIVQWTKAVPLLQDHVPEWREAGNQWLVDISTNSVWINYKTPSLLTDLSRLGLFPIAEVVSAVRTQAESRTDTATTYAIQDELHTAYADSYTEEEWGEICEEFKAYFDEVLEDPTGYLDRTEEFDLLSERAESFGFEDTEDRIDFAREELDEADHEGREPDYDPDDWRDDERGTADFGDSDSNIAEMFDRLG